MTSERDTPLEFLFDHDLIPLSCHQNIPKGYKLRPLASSDHSRGHFELLSVLTVAPKLTEADYAATFKTLKSCPLTYFTIVIVQEADDKVVACGSLIVERKFVRSAGLVGHIEDIAVSKAMQGKKFGIKIINVLEAIGNAQGCYKIILDCSKDNIPFYEKCGFKHKEYQMVKYKIDSSRLVARL